MASTERSERDDFPNHCDSGLDVFGTGIEKRVPFSPGSSLGEEGSGATFLAVWTRPGCGNGELAQQHMGGLERGRAAILLALESLNGDVLGSRYLAALPEVWLFNTAGPSPAPRTPPPSPIVPGQGASLSSQPRHVARELLLLQPFVGKAGLCVDPHALAALLVPSAYCVSQPMR